MKPYISLIIPAFNEEERIGDSLSNAIEYLNSKHYNYEIIVVDDGSTDNTLNIASNHEPKVKIIKQPKNTGKGAAVRRGMLESTGDFRIFTDADFSTPIYEVDKLINEFQKGIDVAIGSRAVDYSLIKKHQPFYREFMGKTFNKIVRLLIFHGVKDTQCGFKGFSEKAAIDIFSKAKINGFGFDVEILYIAKKKGYHLKEIPVEWYNDSRSRVSPVKDSLKMFIELFEIRNLHPELKIKKFRK